MGRSSEDNKGGLRSKARRSGARIKDTYVLPLVPFGSLLSRVSRLTLQESERRLTRKEICKLDRGQKVSSLPWGDDRHTCRFRFPYLVSILSSHARGSCGTREPHGALHPVTTSGTNRAFLTLQDTREEVMAWTQPRLQLPP